MIDTQKIVAGKESDEEKDISLSELMTKMEKEFKIPILKNEKWEKKTIIALYRKISMSRSF